MATTSQKPSRAGKPSPPSTLPDTQTFRATLEPDHTSLKWTIAHVPFDPFDPHALWPTMLRLRVLGTVNGVPFRTSLFPSRHPDRPGHFLLVNKRLQKDAGISPGQTATFTLAPDLAPRPASLPATLIEALQADRKLLRWTQTLPEHTLREIAKWVDQPATPASRARRAEQIAYRLLHAMQGEHTPPPILEAAFARQPEARRGWSALTPHQRRGHLLAIFYYSSPEARQRSADKAIAEALHAHRQKHPL